MFFSCSRRRPRGSATTVSRSRCVRTCVPGAKHALVSGDFVGFISCWLPFLEGCARWRVAGLSPLARSREVAAQAGRGCTSGISSAISARVATGCANLSRRSNMRARHVFMRMRSRAGPGLRPLFWHFSHSRYAAAGCCSFGSDGNKVFHAAGTRLSAVAGRTTGGSRYSGKPLLVSTPELYCYPAGHGRPRTSSHVCP